MLSRCWEWNRVGCNVVNFSDGRNHRFSWLARNRCWKQSRKEEVISSQRYRSFWGQHAVRPTVRAEICASLSTVAVQAVLNPFRIRFKRTHSSSHNTVCLLSRPTDRTPLRRVSFYIFPSCSPCHSVEWNSVFAGNCMSSEKKNNSLSTANHNTVMSCKGSHPLPGVLLHPFLPHPLPLVKQSTGIYWSVPPVSLYPNSVLDYLAVNTIP